MNSFVERTERSKLELDGLMPHAQLHPEHEKNREGNATPLRADLVDDLRTWLADRQNRRQAQRLPADTLLFDVPTGLLRILDRDLKAAGIPKKDERGRTLDIHALRHSFGTLLSKGNVAPRTAQAAMRHSSIDLTMNVYTDPKLLDVHSALGALPQLPLRTAVQTFAPLFAPKAAEVCETVAISDNLEQLGNEEIATGQRVLLDAKGSHAMSCGEPLLVGATGRLLNFFWPESGHWRCSHTSMTR